MENKILDLLALLIPYDTNIDLVRIGQNGDGGYVIPNDFADVTDVISLGISDEVSFDLYFAERGAKVHQFDPSVDGPPLYNQNFHFHKEGFGVYENAMHNNLDTILSKCGLSAGNKKILKFDVEGSEYTGLCGSSDEALNQFSIITGEFHSLDWIQRIEYYDTFYLTFKKLSKLFTPVHVHPNNGGPIAVIDNTPIPSLLEISYIRNDLVTKRSVNVKTRSPLDCRNLPGRAEIFWNPANFFY